MRKQILLLFYIACGFHLLRAQVEYNSTGVLGLGYTIDAAGPVIAQVMPGSPAYVAGLQKNYRLININNQSLEGITMDQLTEKLKVSPGASIQLIVQDNNQEQRYVLLEKARYFSATYRTNKYTIFFDANANTLSKRAEPCVWGDCYSGLGYNVYSPATAFYGITENGLRKEGLYYYSNEGKPYYYLGTFADNDYSGKGILTYPNQNNEQFTYTGDFLNGKANGTGEIKSQNGKIIYTGSFRNWDYDGFGRYTAADGTIQEGQWKAGVFQEEKKNVTDPYAGMSELGRAEAMLRAEKTADSLYRAKLYAQAVAAVGAPSSGASTSRRYTLDELADLMIKKTDASKFTFYQTYDVEFSKNKKGIGSVGCKQNPSFINLLVEENIPGISFTNLRQLEPSGNVTPPSGPSKYENWEKLSVVKGFDLYTYYIHNKASGTCTLNWEISSSDEKTHRAKVMVFDFKKK